MGLSKNEVIRCWDLWHGWAKLAGFANSTCAQGTGCQDGRLQVQHAWGARQNIQRRTLLSLLGLVTARRRCVPRTLLAPPAVCASHLGHVRLSAAPQQDTARWDKAHIHFANVVACLTENPPTADACSAESMVAALLRGVAAAGCWQGATHVMPQQCRRLPTRVSLRTHPTPHLGPPKSLLPPTCAAVYLPKLRQLYLRSWPGRVQLRQWQGVRSQ